MRKLLLGAFVLAVLVAGCTALAHLKALQPPGVPKSAPIALPSPTPSGAQAPTGTFQRGIDIAAYTYPGENIAAAAVADVTFIKDLHANAVSISFPVYVAGPSSSRVYGSSATPSPAALGLLVADAEHAGLFVSIRPLLDETNLGISRVHWSPPNPTEWFRSYTHFLLPYAAMARREGAQELIVGTELTLFASSPRWNELDRKIRKLFHGTLACANNWASAGFTGNCGQGVTETVDAYHPEHPPLLRGWEAFDRAVGAGTVETEVGIDAVPGAFRKPYQHSWPSAVIDQSVQVRWFTAACQAAAHEHLGGIYFWSIGFSTNRAGPSRSYQGLWAGGTGAHAISTCFGALARGPA